MTKKKCSTCGIEKEPAEFQVRRVSHDGLTASCKRCLSLRDKARYKDEQLHRAMLHQKYMATPSGRAAHKKATETWRRKNAVKRAAHVILNNAVRDGRIRKLPCQVCGRQAQAHHHDYSKPLEVIWLCVEHHQAEHHQARNPKEKP